ncbi:carbohydrate-binding protein [Fulvivirga ligni]|uniref:carbohydrate-binding protein n=1 Tax=Fulvivirga ligni TaxID=2904246 RepID=UPI001F489000|nr:carbohydrate-binding protein [Fulvivirga ligni]UII19969.1 carbohydrate-binding protein [Fulvivirga ligni]
MKTFTVFTKILAAFVILLTSALETFAQSTLYVGGHFRRERNHTVADLKASGFTNVILFNINVDTQGNLQMDGEPICTNGQYTFGSVQPNYINDVSSLKSGNTSITRIETCIGGWGSESYNHIKDLINAQGTGANTNLYKNFQALKNALPWIDAINNDDEHAYDAGTATAFHVMLADLGFKTTLAPYTNKSYWQTIANNINGQRPGAVDRIYIQCYDGGAGNNPCNWHIGGIPLHAGMLHFNSSATINSQMTSWKNSCNVVGGFLWVYNANDFNLQNHAAAINTVFAGNPADYAVTVYQDCNYGGYAVGLNEGSYNMSDLQAKGIVNDDISSLRIKAGYKATLYWDINFTGSTVTKTSDDACLVDDGFNDQATSIVISKTSSSNLIEAESYSSMAGVDVESCSEGGQNVGWIDSGDWMAFNNINFPSSGTYLIEYRVASAGGGGSLSADLNAGATVLGTLSIPGTGGWQNWTTISHTVNVNAGTYPLGIFAQTGGWNLNWVKITYQGSASSRRGSLDSEITELTDIQVFPNPIINSARINLNSPSATVHITDATGREVMTPLEVKNNEDIDFSHLQKGMYLLQIEIGEKAITKRIIKQ